MTDYPEKGGTPCIGNYTEYSPTGFSFLGGGGVLPISIVGMIVLGQKSKLKKIPGPKFNPQEIPCQIS